MSPHNATLSSTSLDQQIDALADFVAAANKAGQRLHLLSRITSSSLWGCILVPSCPISFFLPAANDLYCNKILARHAKALDALPASQNIDNHCDGQSNRVQLRQKPFQALQTLWLPLRANCKHASIVCNAQKPCCCCLFPCSRACTSALHTGFESVTSLSWAFARKDCGSIQHTKTGSFPDFSILL